MTPDKEIISSRATVFDEATRSDRSAMTVVYPPSVEELVGVLWDREGGLRSEPLEVLAATVAPSYREWFISDMRQMIEDLRAEGVGVHQIAQRLIEEASPEEDGSAREFAWAMDVLSHMGRTFDRDPDAEAARVDDHDAWTLSADATADEFTASVSRLVTQSRLAGLLHDFNAWGNTFPHQSPGEWFVLRTKPRQELLLAGELHSRGIASFLPTITCTKFYGGRKALVELPVFPGYLFLHGDVDEAYEADRTRRVSQIIRAADQEGLDRQLRNIHVALKGNAALDPFPYLHAGVRVEVREGAFRGLQGLVERDGRQDRVVLQVDILGRAVSLEIDPSLLDVIDARASGDHAASADAG